MSTERLGYKTSAPIIIAPTAMHKLAHPGGEILTAKAATACNVIMGLSFIMIADPKRKAKGNLKTSMSTEIDDASEIANFTDGSKLASLASTNADASFSWKV
ncbi:peroxisomal (S)-2-hydroxy-acid oxidase GLO4-like protein [Tanacetum coccineum]